MITPRQARLVRVADLRGLHAVLVDRIAAQPPALARATAIIVPTRGGAEALRRTLENRLLSSGTSAFVLPDLVTRGDFYLALHRQLPAAPAWLTPFEREVILRRAARAASDAGAPAPFRLRARLIAAVLDFYDDLRRNGRTVADFDRLLVDSLEPSAEMDRGAERLLRQTRFLTATLTAFEASCASTGRLDEHGLRLRLLATPRPSGYRRVVVTVGDQAADRQGLWAADYDLLTRAPGIEQIEIVATERQLAAGLGERLADFLPGMDTVPSGPTSRPPTLVVPEGPAGDVAPRWFTSRDREEELADVIRAVRDEPAPDRVGLVYQRPLPYLYVARQLLPDAGIPYQALDSLPLAAEPFAAALDLVFEVALSAATRGAVVDLLRSPHWRFTSDRALTGPGIDALDALLLSRKYLGGWGRLDEIEVPAGSGGASAHAAMLGDALAAARVAAREIEAIVEAPTGSAQFRALLAFVARSERLPGPADPDASRHGRARAAVLGALGQLADAHASHDDEPLLITDFAGAIRRWIEGQTFAPATGTTGLSLLDARAAAYADLDEVRLLGMVESDWPERPSRSIFYPASLLALLGWPSERPRLAAARASFHDLLHLGRRRVALSTVALEDDAVVPPSPFLEDLDSAGLPVSRVAAGPRPLVFAQEAMRTDGATVDGLGPERTAWLAMRRSRTPGSAPAYHGAAGPQPAGAYAVSRVERYLECPFKYYAAHVLRLEEEQHEASGLTPRERGAFLHEVVERFFIEWTAAGHASITAADIEEARALFTTVADRHLDRLPESERALERTHLLGSAAAPGLAERLITLEIEQEVGVIERLLEHELTGEFEIAGADGPVRLRLRGKADRIDLLDDHSIRIVDYKLGRAPRSSKALQLPIYGVCASQQLQRQRGGAWPVSRAGYVAFRERNAFTPIASSAAGVVQAMADGQRRLVEAVASIERGDFPVAPEEPFLCTRCGYAGLCRKDYVGDE